MMIIDYQEIIILYVFYQKKTQNINTIITTKKMINFIIWNIRRNALNAAYDKKSIY